MTDNFLVRDLPTTMRGLVQQHLSGPDLVPDPALPVPRPGPGEYLVRVEAAGLNFADVMQASGRYLGGPSAPYVAGFEAAGEVVATGSGVDPISLRSYVLGTGPGAFAEYVVMGAAAASPVPHGWTAAEALGLVLNWGTALAALRPMGQLAPQEWVLVHAAAGGVGQAAIRLAHHFGAKVVAAAGRAKHADVHALGAEVVLDSRSSDLREQVLDATGGVDLVLEAVGRSTFHTSLSVVRPFTGRIVVYGAPSGDASISTHDLVFERRVHLAGLHIGAMAQQAPHLYAAVLSELQHLIDRGVVQPGHPTVYPMLQGPEAIRALAGGHTVGKLAIDPSR